MTQFIINFKGSSTINEAYQIQLKDIKDTLAVLPEDDIEALQEQRRDLLELVAILENKLARVWIRKTEEEFNRNICR